MIAFKRLEVGVKFSRDGVRYRKVGTRVAFKLKPSGTGETHIKLRFARSTMVEPC